MTTVLDGQGFQAELTPASKDGGKDIILEVASDSGSETYIVELKHWRSGRRVGDSVVRDFDAFQTLTEIKKTTVKFGGKTKVVRLCWSYLHVGDDLWQPADEDGLKDILLSDTFNI